MQNGTAAMENSVEIPKNTGNRTVIHPIIHCCPYTPWKPELKETHIPQCPIQHYLQQLGHGSNLDIHRQTNRSESCGTYTQWNITQLLKRMHLSQFQRSGQNLSLLYRVKYISKKKHPQSILTHIYGILKDSNDNPMCKTARETDIKNRLLDSVGEGKGGMI